MTAIEIALAFAQIVFPLFLAVGGAISFATPANSQKIIPIQMLLFGVALASLWVAIIAGVSALVPPGSALDILVAFTMIGLGVLVTFLVGVPLAALLIEVAIYRQSQP